MYTNYFFYRSLQDLQDVRMLYGSLGCPSCTGPPVGREENIDHPTRTSTFCGSEFWEWDKRSLTLFLTIRLSIVHHQITWWYYWVKRPWFLVRSLTNQYYLMLFITLQDVCLRYMYDNYLVRLYWHKANSASKIVATHKAVKQFLKREGVGS